MCRHHIEKLAKPILFVEQIDDDTEGKRKTEEHGSVNSARLVRAFQQPQHATDEQRRQW